MTNIKAFRDYVTDSETFTGVREVVRVTGFAQVGNERWCRIRTRGEHVSSMLCHPNRIVREATSTDTDGAHA